MQHNFQFMKIWICTFLEQIDDEIFWKFRSNTHPTSRLSASHLNTSFICAQLEVLYPFGDVRVLLTLVSVNISIVFQRKRALWWCAFRIGSACIKQPVCEFKFTSKYGICMWNVFRNDGRLVRSLWNCRIQLNRVECEWSGEGCNKNDDSVLNSSCVLLMFGWMKGGLLKLIFNSQNLYVKYIEFVENEYRNFKVGKKTKPSLRSVSFGNNNFEFDTKAFE